MGTNKTRNAAVNGTNKDREGFTSKLRWENADFSWDSDPADQTWDDAAGQPGGTNPGTNKDRVSATGGSNKSRVSASNGSNKSRVSATGGTNKTRN